MAPVLTLAQDSRQFEAVQGIGDNVVQPAVSTAVIKWKVPAEQRASRPMRWVLAALLGLSAVTGFGVAYGGPKTDISETCSGVSECRGLLSSAELALEGCTISCQEEQRHYLVVRDLFRDALERQAVEEHQVDVRRLVERRETLRAQAAAVEAQQQLLVERAREQEHQRQLELIQAEADREAAARAREEQDQVRYFSLLNAKQRRSRLSNCHELKSNCEALVRLLVASAGTAAERRSIVELHERAVTGEAPAPARVGPVSAKPAQQTAPLVEGVSPASEPPVAELPKPLEPVSKPLAQR